jgi:hypothetical protein
VVVLFITELTTLSERITGDGGCSEVLTPGTCTTMAGDAHSHMLWLLAAAVLVFTFGAAIGGSRPAALAVAACGIVVLVIALALDRPDLDDTRGLEVQYLDVTARTGPAYMLEIIGGVLAVAAALAALTRRRPRAADKPRTADDAPRGGGTPRPKLSLPRLPRRSNPADAGPVDSEAARAARAAERERARRERERQRES